MRRCALRALLVACCAVLSVARAEVVPVVGAQSPLAGLTREEVADVFLGKPMRLPGGIKPVPLDQVEGSPARDEFYRRYTGKSPAQVKALWSKLIFTGRGRPPRMLADGAEVLREVRANPLSIGYVDRQQVDATVRVLPARPPH